VVWLAAHLPFVQVEPVGIGWWMRLAKNVLKQQLDRLKVSHPSFFFEYEGDLFHALVGDGLDKCLAEPGDFACIRIARPARLAGGEAAVRFAARAFGRLGTWRWDGRGCTHGVTPVAEDETEPGGHRRNRRGGIAIAPVSVQQFM